MALKVTRQDVEQFRTELWKDERHFPPRTEAGVFIKDCFSTESARQEFRVLEALAAAGDGESLAPTPLEIQGSTLKMGAAKGMRLFEVLRALRDIELKRRDGKANEARETLMARQRQRLARIQEVLLAEARVLGSVPYPVEEKLARLLSLLARVLGLAVTDAHLSELERFSRYWDASCAQIPFRDATPKNTIVSHPKLERSRRSSGGEADRRCVVQILEQVPLGWWETVPLVEIDFSSVEHLTTLEDDPISLHFHEWTFGSCPTEPTSLLLLPTQSRVDPFRTAASLLVRYMRFGGRKLAYRLINSQGFEIRFRYDEPLFYFRNLRRLLESLSSEFSLEFQGLVGLIERIGEAAATASRSDQALRVDYFRKLYGKPGAYWPENPMEWEDGS